MVPKDLVKGTEAVGNRERSETIQTLASLRKVLETWGDLLLLRPQCKNS